MDIRALALEMAESVGLFVQKARLYFYRVVLLGYSCPKCNGSLEMYDNSRCRCKVCGYTFDPTIHFQRCPDCDGRPALIVRRYHCQHCGREMPSKFVFDALVFNTEYFRQKMAESRSRKRQQREKVRRMLAACRSRDLQFGPADLDSVPGLVEALNSLTLDIEKPTCAEPSQRFDLMRYESHIQANIKDFAVSLTEIPPINEDVRKDLIWRFVAVIFLAHAGTIDIWQEGQLIIVKKHEAD